MRFSTSFLAASLALTPFVTALPHLSARQSTSVQTGFYNIINGVGTLLTLNTNNLISGNSSSPSPQSQVWAITELAGKYLILNNGTGGSIQDLGYTTIAGIQVQGVTVAPGSSTQSWTFKTVGTNTYNIVNVGSTRLLDVFNSFTADGTPVISWPYNGGYKNQNWTLKAVV